MSCDSLGTVYVNRTDKVPVRDREDIIQEIKDLAGRLRTAEIISAKVISSMDFSFSNTEFSP